MAKSNNWRRAWKYESKRIIFWKPLKKQERPKASACAVAREMRAVLCSVPNAMFFKSPYYKPSQTENTEIFYKTQCHYISNTLIWSHFPIDISLWINILYTFRSVFCSSSLVNSLLLFPDIKVPALPLKTKDKFPSLRSHPPSAEL